MQLNRTCLFLTLCIATLISSTSCTKTSRLGDPTYLPDNWLSLRNTAWQITELPEINRVQLENLHIQLHKERQGQYYNFFGKYNPETLSLIDSVTSNLDTAYLDLRYSSKAILLSLTPSQQGLADTEAERLASIAVTKNVNHRSMHDDINHILLLDRPSSLSIYPTVQD
ncbi:MAG: hypothetical protein HOI88_02810 [Phycisphaerae bacterium]|jgi:hypothetical protein|nr:hypothetical protein [Phycisphaerae bacterium]MBT6269265.1 hypothetical protein [Phycisphaerae bacterium]MBT6282760.1 hypothetical protein [Phycisphaerae bacterium]